MWERRQPERLGSASIAVAVERQTSEQAVSNDQEQQWLAAVRAENDAIKSFGMYELVYWSEGARVLL